MYVASWVHGRPVPPLLPHTANQKDLVLKSTRFVLVKCSCACTPCGCLLHSHTPTLHNIVATRFDRPTTSGGGERPRTQYPPPPPSAWPAHPRAKRLPAPPLSSVPRRGVSRSRHGAPRHPGGHGWNRRHRRWRRSATSKSPETRGCRKDRCRKGFRRRCHDTLRLRRTPTPEIGTSFDRDREENEERWSGVVMHIVESPREIHPRARKSKRRTRAAIYRRSDPRLTRHSESTSSPVFTLFSRGGSSSQPCGRTWATEVRSIFGAGHPLVPSSARNSLSLLTATSTRVLRKLWRTADYVVSVHECRRGLVNLPAFQDTVRSVGSQR